MAKASLVRYRCGECGSVSLTWSGKCPSCGSGGTLYEEREEKEKKASSKPLVPAALDEVTFPERLPSGLSELDRVLGGGWVAGSVVLIGGEPGIGKSTLLLQACSFLGEKGTDVLYISGEESAAQVALRAKRLGARGGNLRLLCHDDIDEALSVAADARFVVVDSVQALRSADVGGWPGTISQVRAVTQRCIDFAKERNVPVVLVGHITKEGQIAGPKLMEHMVDVVLLFSGERTSSYRVLRGVKNRYGSTDEVGLFEMSERGLSPVVDPSSLYWSGMESSASGVAMGVVLEGSRPLVAEIQCLACPTPFPYPKRTARGIETSRVQLLLAVLERRCGCFSRTHDVYVNVVGGLQVRDPAVDLPLALALASALKDVPLRPDLCMVGEVGLAGEVRPASRTHLRLREASRLGFRRALVSRAERDVGRAEGVEVIAVKSLKEAMGVVMR